MGNFLLPRAQNVNISGCCALKIILRCFLFNPYQIHLTKTKNPNYYYLFTRSVFPLPVNEPETTKCWPVSPAFIQSALQTMRQHDFFLPSLHEEPEAHSYEAKQILQPPLKPGFKLLKLLSSDRTISEKLGKKWREWDPILLPLDFSSKRAQYEDSDLVWTEAGFHEDCDLVYPHHRFGYRCFKFLYEAQKFHKPGSDLTRRSKGKTAWVHAYRRVGFVCVQLFFDIVLC